MTLTYKGEEVTFDMPGWYFRQYGESIYTGKDLRISVRMLNRLKARSGGTG
jgi:HTH-type transcriptional regulator / antitoxin MqsA